MVSLPLVPEHLPRSIPKLNPWDQLPSKGPHLQDPCLSHVASVVPSTGLDIEPELSEETLMNG